MARDMAQRRVGDKAAESRFTMNLSYSGFKNGVDCLNMAQIADL
jgi:hypothetical protein